MNKTVFNIDLLKGRGLPIKSRPEGVIIGVLGFALPVFMFMLFGAWYFSNDVLITVQARQLNNYQSKIEQLSGLLETHQQLMADKHQISKGLEEVSLATQRYTVQWSGILEELVRQMPDAVVMTGLEVRRRHARVNVPRLDDPDRTVEIQLPARTLEIALRARAGEESDQAVQNFRQRLLESELLTGQINDINVSQQVERIGDDYVAIYHMKCAFKLPN